MLELTSTKLQDHCPYTTFFHPCFVGGIRLVHYKSDDYTNSFTRACFMVLKYSLLDLCACNHKDKVANGAMRGCSKYKSYIYSSFFWGGWGGVWVTKFKFHKKTRSISPPNLPNRRKRGINTTQTTYNGPQTWLKHELQSLTPL